LSDNDFDISNLVEKPDIQTRDLNNLFENIRVIVDSTDISIPTCLILVVSKNITNDGKATLNAIKNKIKQE